jgi:hypothetical protein
MVPQFPRTLNMFAKCGLKKEWLENNDAKILVWYM